MSNPFDSILGANRGANTAAKVRPFQRGENVIVKAGHKLAGSVGVVKGVEGDLIGVMLRRGTEIEVFEKTEINRVERADQEAEFKLTEDVTAPAGSEKHKVKMQVPTLVTTEDGLMGFMFADGEDESPAEDEGAAVLVLEDEKGESRLGGDNADASVEGDEPSSEADSE